MTITKELLLGFATEQTDADAAAIINELKRLSADKGGAYEQERHAFVALACAVGILVTQGSDLTAAYAMSMQDLLGVAWMIEPSQ